MPTTMTNQAKLRFSYGSSVGTASSNIASTVIQGPLSASKSVLEAGYRADGALTYMLHLQNSGAAALAPVTVTDDLGKYAVSPALSVTPLTYVGPTRLYVNGAYVMSLTPSVTADAVTFTVPSLAAGANAMLVYNARVNEYAMPTPTSEIVNTAVIDAPGLTDAVTVTDAIPAADYADVSITKTMSPNPVTDGALLTSTFLLQNFGNTDASNVVLTDTFSPAPAPIAVTVNGVTLADTEYDYVGGLLTLPGAAATYALTVPAAAFPRDPATGEVSVNPGAVTIVVTGTI